MCNKGVKWCWPWVSYIHSSIKQYFSSPQGKKWQWSRIIGFLYVAPVGGFATLPCLHLNLFWAVQVGGDCLWGIDDRGLEQRTGYVSTYSIRGRLHRELLCNENRKCGLNEAPDRGDEEEEKVVRHNKGCTFMWKSCIKVWNWTPPKSAHDTIGTISSSQNCGGCGF